MLEVLAIRSPVTATLILFLARARQALARQLSEVVGIESKNVYPYLRPWFGRFVEVVKIGGLNLYRATERLLKASREALEALEEATRKSRGKVTKRKILEEARRRFRERHGFEMDRDHELVLQIFVDYAMSRSSPYIQVDPSKGETLPKIVAGMVKEKHGKDLDEEKTIEILRNLELAGVIYIDRRHYKARLDKSLLLGT